MTIKVIGHAEIFRVKLSVVHVLAATLADPNVRQYRNRFSFNRVCFRTLNNSRISDGAALFTNELLCVLHTTPFYL
jgi:hypothetical protein